MSRMIADLGLVTAGSGMQNAQSDVDVLHKQRCSPGTVQKARLLQR